MDHTEGHDTTMVTEARCPSCATPLTQLTTSATVIAGCPRCGGIWLDSRGCEALARGDFDDDKKKFARSLDEGSPPPERTVFRDAATPPPERRACPVCAADLWPSYLHDANITVELCAAHGTFFTRGELLRAAEAAAIRIAAGPDPIPVAIPPPPPPPSQAARALLGLGAAAFLASMVMPSVQFNFFSTSTAPGVVCAALGFVFIAKTPNIFLAACGNAWLVTCPIYAWRLRARGSAILSALAAFFGAMAASVWLIEQGKDLLAGFYVWVASYFVIAIGFLIRALHQRAQTPR